MQIKSINHTLIRDRFIYILLFCVGFVLLMAIAAIAQSAAPSPSAQEIQQRISTDTALALFTALPIFCVNLGYSLWVAGVCIEQPGKIVGQNLATLALTVVLFWVIGFGLMFGDGNGFLGLDGIFLLSGTDNSPATGDQYQGAYSSLNWAGIALNVKFLFLAACAVVSSSILSSVFSQQTGLLLLPQKNRRYATYLFCGLFIGLIYPITGHWIWGGGWLYSMGFWDWAGATTIFSVGGWAALSCAWVFRSSKEGAVESQSTSHPRSQHTFASFGFVILCLGILALNVGSTLGFADGRAVSHITVTTIVSAVGGAAGGMVASWIYLRRQEPIKIMQGALSGLVAISAACFHVSVAWAIEIGFIASILTFLAGFYIAKTRISDTAGLISISLVGGVWGTLSIGLFAAGPSNALYSAGPDTGLFNGGSPEQLFRQLAGIIAVGIFTTVLSTIFLLIIKSSLLRQRNTA